MKLERMRLLGSSLLVRRIPEMKESEGGIIIPDSATEKPMEGVVLVAGPGRMTDTGLVLPMFVEVGDKVLFKKFAGVEVANNKEGMFLIMDQTNILGILP